MTEPTSRRSLDWASVRDLVVVAVAVALTIWTLLDSTLPAWLYRLSVAGAITAGLALALLALHRTVVRK